MTRRTNVPRQEAFEAAVSPAAWEPTGSENDPRSQLLASAIINGCRFHMDAYATDPEALE